jgi:hypothetical protein
MATNVRDTQGDTGTDPAARSPVRPDYVFLGVDGDGGDHVYRTFEESVHVIRDGRGVHVQEFDGKDVDHWMAYIEGKRGGPIGGTASACWNCSRRHSHGDD